MANEYFGKVSEKGIQILVVTVVAGLVTALTTKVGIVLDSTYKAITRNMLVKRVKINGYINGVAANQPIILAIGANDTGVASGHAAGNEGALLNPENSATYLGSAELVKTIWHETTQCMVRGPTDAGQSRLVINETFSIGGGKGIPCMAGAGPELTAYNPSDSTLTDGAEFIGTYTIYGVWLED